MSVGTATATDRAYDYAKAKILDGEIRGGELITEGDVAERVGVSRTPVREAFLRLQHEGLLRLYPKRGALVVPVSAAEVEDVLETRLLVECFAIEKVGRATPDFCAALERAVEKQKRHAKRGDAAAFVDADREFHRHFVAELGNEILLDLHDSLRDRQRRMGLVAIAAQRERVQQIISEHVGLISAVGRGDTGEACALLEKHLEGTRALLRMRPTG
jgi:DNA-binding GntR family transcriptional regulator